MKSNKKTICLELPDHFVDFIEEISRNLGMNPSQFMAHILKYYYEVFKVTKDSIILQQLEQREGKEVGECQLEQLFNEFVKQAGKELKKAVIREFIEWVRKKSLKPSMLSENDIKEFLEFFIGNTSYSKHTIREHKRSLRLFLEYIEKICKERVTRNS